MTRRAGRDSMPARPDGIVVGSSRRRFRLKFRDAVRPLIQWFAQRVDHLRRRLHLTWQGFAAAVAALFAAGASGIVLIAVSQDVLFSDGLAPRDPANLQLFTDHRSELVDSAARVLTQAGSVAVLVPLALIAGML